MARLSGNQIDGLGRRLRDSAFTGDEDLQMLQALLTEHAIALDQVNECLRGLGLTPHPRLKSTDMIVEKLRREPLSLRGIHDLAGTRVVKRMSLDEQDELVARIGSACPGAEDPIDRRANPNNGYRAVHVVCRIDGRWVEVQVRTLYQDTWAQAMEKMGDWFGRQIRYGEMPTDPHGLFGSQGENPTTRLETLNFMIHSSEEIANLEAQENREVWEPDHPVRRFLYRMRELFELPEVD